MPKDTFQIQLTPRRQLFRIRLTISKIWYIICTVKYFSTKVLKCQYLPFRIFRLKSPKKLGFYKQLVANNMSCPVR